MSHEGRPCSFIAGCVSFRPRAGNFIRSRRGDVEFRLWFFYGEDLMVFDSDNNYPDCKFPHSVEANVGQEEIPEAKIAKIIGENTSRLVKV